ncbi:maestro heat-like repeat-containing protein family member 1 isoform X1 [Loxodonta africana]|uniref:maestro heat-like repeat-containing protein family member 1 isoform X1 n=1 Tax=Loxodonta africana TaxID=9785 RepID=UPI0030D09F82
MFTVMVVSSETAERDLEWDASGRNIEIFMDSLQVPGELSAEKVLQTLKLLETKILNHKMTTPLCQKVTNSIINYLRIMKPEGELEEMCTAVLIALGSYCPGMVTIKLWDKFHNFSLPPRSLLMAVGKLSFGQGVATYIGPTWEYILRLLRKAERENDMLAICQVLNGLAISARKHLDLRRENEEVMDISAESLSIKACQTLRVLFNRWPLKNNSKVTEQALVVIGHLFFLMPSPKLKNQVNWLTRRLMTLTEAKLDPFYISQCIYKLLGALAVSGSGGVNLASQLENIVDMLFKQVREKVNSSDPHTVQNYSFTLKAFYTLTKLYNEQMVLLLRKVLESTDPVKVASALQVFTYVFWEVSQTEKVKSDVMNSVIIVIQEDFKLVRVALLYFLERLAQCGYLNLPQGNVIINYLIKLSELNSSVQRNQAGEGVEGWRVRARLRGGGRRKDSWKQKGKKRRGGWHDEEGP